MLTLLAAVSFVGGCADSSSAESDVAAKLERDARAPVISCDEVSHVQQLYLCEFERPIEDPSGDHGERDNRWCVLRDDQGEVTLLGPRKLYDNPTCG